MYFVSTWQEVAILGESVGVTYVAVHGADDSDARGRRRRRGLRRLLR